MKDSGASANNSAVHPRPPQGIKGPHLPRCHLPGRYMKPGTKRNACIPINAEVHNDQVESLLCQPVLIPPSTRP